MISEQDWIDAALDCLLREGASNVKVERLARDLGVTKGSFYWHFKDRSDLLHRTASFWVDRQRGFVESLRSAEHATPETRLEALLAFTATKDARADVAMRLWARRADWVDELVAEVDEARLAYCEEVFRAMGYEGDAARLRAHLVYYYQVAEQTLSFREPNDRRQRLDRLRFDLLVGHD